MKKIITAFLLVLIMLTNTACSTIMTSTKKDTATVETVTTIDSSDEIASAVAPGNTPSSTHSLMDYVATKSLSLEFESVDDDISKKDLLAEVYSYAISLIAYDIHTRGYEVSEGTATSADGTTYIGLVFTDGSDYYEVDGTSIPTAGFVQLFDSSTTSYLTTESVEAGVVAVVGENEYLVNKHIAIDDFSGFANGCYFIYSQETPFRISINVEIIRDDNEDIFDYSVDCYDFDNDRIAWRKDITRPVLSAVSMYSEESVYNTIIDTMNEMVKIQEENHYTSERSIFVAIDPALIDALYRSECIEAINGFIVSQINSLELTENQFIVISASEGVQVFEMPDYDELVAQRKSSGWLQVIGASAMLLGSVILTCVSLGTASAATVPGAITSIAVISGAAASIYAVSNLIEGINNIRLANLGDITSEAMNPVRNAFVKAFGENGTTIYNAVGITAMTIQSLMLPVGAGLRVSSSIGAGAMQTVVIVGKAVLFNVIEMAVIGSVSTVTAMVVENAVLESTGDAIKAEWSGLAAGFITGVIAGAASFKLDKTFNFSGLYTKSSVLAEMRRQNLNKAISDMAPDRWSKMSESAQKRAIQRLAKFISDDIGLDNMPIVKYFCEEPDVDGRITYGYYNPQDGSININTHAFDDSLSVIDTIGHELMHGRQWELLENGVIDDVTDSLINYITPEEDYAGYILQPCEREAFNMGEFWRDFVRGVWYE